MMVKSRRFWLAPLLVGLTLVTACAGAGAPTTAGVPAGPAGSDESAAAWAAREVRDPPLRPGDVIRLRIWREPDLSGEFMLDRTGSVVLPRIGTIMAADYTPAELEALVREEYGKYLRNPSIEIVPMRRINILGAVRSPGLYAVDPTMTLADALALAGGVQPNGRQDRVELFRGEHRLVTEATAQMKIEDLGVRSGDQIYVPERMWVSRNAGVLATVASTVISATVSLIIAFSR
jgi:protein involved in polysaccharide export with SLBB domain